MYKILVRPVVVSLAVGQARDVDNIDIVCHQKATFIAKMHVHHGLTLMLRNLVRMNTKQAMAEPLLTLKQAVPFREWWKGVYHSAKRIDSPSTDVDEGWLDFGIDDPSKKKEGVEKMIQRASDAGISDT